MAEEFFTLWPLLLPLALLGGLSGGSTGFGTYLVIGPALWALFSPTEAIALALIAGIPSIALLFFLWESVLWRDVRKIILWSLPGLALGATAHFLLSPATLSISAGAVIIILVALRIGMQKSLPFPLAGVGAGTLSSSVGFNGPPISLAFHGQEERTQRASTIATLLVFSLLVTSLFLGSGEREEFSSALLWGLVLLPPVALGTWMGNRWARVLGRKIEYLAIAISILGATALLLRA